MHQYKLFLAAIWLVFGVGLLIYDHLFPGGAATVTVGGIDVGLGWVALALAAFNLLRWWRLQVFWQARQQNEQAERRREQARRAREFRESGRERDPNFMFDEPKSET